ncbi:MAG: hypothetical protein A2042_07460 [Candidatus Schekmanbacteria bacterium GWA2_38_11]|uniref:VanZ-like domain-containing protein n=1 Tax=Candidatus Schekmanbacteria bacterium GWA2_38_11 TaxID=1817876 RepID=A0A1F7RQJ2_9BACT|nr:MAG: hypothetical protein A2042_07460 [Candidatus Schekmanbacteria bacterium GWA2_38_11]
MTKSKRISDWLQVLSLIVLICLTIPYTPLLWKPLSADQKSLIITGIYALAFLLGLFILIYLFFYRKERRVLPYLWLFTVALLYLQALNSLKEFPIEKFHLIEYGALGILTFKALKNDIRDLNIYIWSILITFYVGIFDETVQWLVPNRVGAIEDVWLNTKSGILSLMLIGLVIRPKGIETRFYTKNLKKVYIPIFVVLVATGVFINFVHDFGYRMKLSDSIEIYSHFPEGELRSINNIFQRDISFLIKTAERFINKDKSSGDISVREAKALTFFKEAAGHRWERDYAFSKMRFLKSLKEQIILKNDYSSVLYLKPFKWSKDKEMLVEKLAKEERGKDIYISPVSGILITKFSKVEMWFFIGIIILVLIFFSAKLKISFKG